MASDRDAPQRPLRSSVVYWQQTIVDVHKKSVVACICTQHGREVTNSIRTFGTTTDELVALFDWLAAGDITDVVMESTGVYWRPVWKVLLGGFELHLANASEVEKALRGSVRPVPSFGLDGR